MPVAVGAWESGFARAFAVEHCELPLAFAYQMRNAVAHGYFQVDLEIVWKTVQADLPGLYAQVRELLQNLPHVDMTEGPRP